MHSDQRVASFRAHRALCGTASSIADDLETWFRTSTADGFNVMPLTLPQELEAIVDQLIPELRRPGLFRTEYEGKTLRENLGIPVPVTRKKAVPA